MKIGQTGGTAQLLLVAIAFADADLGVRRCRIFPLSTWPGTATRALPSEISFSAVWGSHEGSLLLWEMILCSGLSLVAMFSRRLPDDFSAAGHRPSWAGFPAVSCCLSFLRSNPFEPPDAFRGRWPGSESIAAGSGADHPSAHAVHGLCRFFRIFRFRRCSAAGPAGQPRLGALVAAMDPCRLGCS